MEMAAQPGRVVLVTGASGGLGAAMAAAFSKAGARVVLGVRDVAKGRGIAAGLPGRPEIRRLDLGDLGSIRSFAHELDTDIDVLINNAGIMGVPKGVTVDGFERQFGVNHLGPFALTGLLLPRLRDRVVTVSSQGHRQGRLDLADPHARHRDYEPSAAYAQSKLANLLFTYELQRRLDACGSGVRSLAAHPGLAQSNILMDAAPSPRLRLFRLAQRWLGQSAEAGALPIIYAATADLPGGSYVGPGGFYELRGRPKVVDSSRASKDMVAAEELWNISEHQTGVRYPQC